MSNIPYYLPGARTGYRLGNNSVVDGLVNDGLWDVYNNQHPVVEDVLILNLHLLHLMPHTYFYKHYMCCESEDWTLPAVTQFALKIFAVIVRK